jgi:hypothetical protein
VENFVVPLFQDLPSCDDKDNKEETMSIFFRVVGNWLKLFAVCTNTKTWHMCQWHFVIF